MRKSKREMKEECYTNKRINVAERMIGMLKTALDEPSMNNLLDFHVNENFRDKIHRRLTKEAPLKMNVWWVEKMLRDALRCASKVKGRVLKEMACELKKRSKYQLSDEDKRRLVVSRIFERKAGVCMRGVRYFYTKDFARLQKRKKFRRHDTRSMHPPTGLLQL